MDQEFIAEIERLMWAAHVGALDSLECPKCHNQSVSVRFTHPREDVYRTWFVCSECSFEARAQNSDRPAHFSEMRVDERLQMYDADILSKRRIVSD